MQSPIRGGCRSRRCSRRWERRRRSIRDRWRWHCSNGGRRAEPRRPGAIARRDRAWPSGGRLSERGSGWAPSHLFGPSLAPPDRHVESQSLETQPEGRTLCTAWQGFLSVGAEERSGAQKTAPWAPHGRDRQPPSFSRCYGGQKMGPVPTADHAATGEPGAHPPWDWENRSIFYPFERRLPRRCRGGGFKMTYYSP